MPPRKPLQAAARPQDAATDRPRGRAEQLADALAQDILGGALPVGSLLPPDAELAASHAVSAAMVRTALKRLENLGLIARSRSAGTRVVSGEIRASYAVEDGAGGQYAGGTALLLDRQRGVSADAETAMLLGAREGSRWLHLSGLRSAGSATLGPLSWVDVWLDTPAEQTDAAPDLSAAGIAALTGAAVASIVEEFAATPLTPALARHLRARVGAPGLHIIRRYRRANGSPLAVVRDIHPADRVSIAVSLDGG